MFQSIKFQIHFLFPQKKKNLSSSDVTTSVKNKSIFISLHLSTWLSEAALTWALCWSPHLPACIVSFIGTKSTCIVSLHITIWNTIWLLHHAKYSFSVYLLTMKYCSESLISLSRLRPPLGLWGRGQFLFFRAPVYITGLIKNVLKIQRPMWGILIYSQRFQIIGREDGLSYLLSNQNMLRFFLVFRLLLCLFRSGTHLVVIFWWWQSLILC